MEGRSQVRSDQPRRQAWIPVFITGLMLLAPFLGGSTRPWSEGIVLAGLGIVIAVCPPRSFGSRALGAVLLGLFALSAFAFLPAAWFGLPAWRLELTGRLGLQLPPTLSPQPWISLDSVILLFAGAVWIDWLQARSWHTEDQRRMFKLYAAGVAVFAGVALAVYQMQFRIPFWLATERMFGPFPNRNQTANFLALGSILSVALGYEAALAKKKGALAWVLALCILGTALVVNYSRGGIVVFFAGVAVWTAILVALSPSVKWISIGASILLSLLAAFLFFGGETLGRFHEEGHLIGFRSLIFKDTFTMIRSSPWCGIGLGNFESLFALFRSASASDARVIHPESDWLWLWSEMGWPAVVLALAGIGILAKCVFPLQHGTNRRLRAAALAAALAGVLHGTVDVSGHRLGSMLPALFIFGLALPPVKPWRADRMAPAVFRSLGLLIALTGLAWVWAATEGVPLPGTIAAEIGKRRTKQLMEHQEFAKAVPSATAALGWKPLDWQLYFARGGARVFSGDWVAAIGDFRRARTLETSSVNTPMQESWFWVSRQPALAVIAWREALRRCQPDEAVEYYRQLLEVASKQPALLLQAHRLASGNARLEAVWLGVAPAKEFDRDLNSLLQIDPALRSLPGQEQSRLFAVWIARGDAPALIQKLEQNPAWQRNGWRVVSDYYAAKNNFEAACKLALRFIDPPAFPKVVEDGDARDLQRRFLVNPSDFPAGYALYKARMEAGREEEALGTLEQVAVNPDCPRYFHYLLAGLRARRQEWEKSWKSIAAFGNPNPAAATPAP